MSRKRPAGKTPKAFFGSGITIPERPWFALTASQRELRLDTVGWSDGHDIFLVELLDHPIRRVRSYASSSNEKTMALLIRAWKLGIDLAAITMQALTAVKDDWSTLPKAAISYTREPYSKSELAAQARAAKASGKPASAASPAPASTAPVASPVVASASLVAPAPAPAAPVEAAAPEKPPAAPPQGGKYVDLGKLLDDIVTRIAGPGRPAAEVERSPRPPRSHARFADVEEPGPAERPAAVPQEGVDAQQAGEPPSEPPTGETRQAAAEATFHAIPDPEDDAIAARAAARKEIELIRSKLVVGGRVRLDVEALSVYILAPSYFAIATSLDPEPWQSRFLDSYALRLGCLASRQSGKSIITARKATAFALCNPATTTLILAPTLRQSSELLLKIAGVVQIAGLKIASLSQFQIVLQDKQPGAASRVVCLPGSNEDSGASTRGYAADMLVLEEASFLADPVIMSVLPSIAARPRAQLIGISSAGIVGSYFHSVMTSPQSRWTKMVVPASKSGRFSEHQLEELKLTLGAKYPVEMECAWGSVGDSIYTQDVLDTAFGTDSTHAAIETEPDLDAAFGHLDLEQLFTAKPFERRVA